MKQALALSAFFLAAACFGQIPDHVPSDGLVGWWDFDGDFCSEDGAHCFEEFGALQFPASNDSAGHVVEFNGGYLELGADEAFDLEEFTIVLRGYADDRIEFWKGSPGYPDDLNYRILLGSSGVHSVSYSSQCGQTLDGANTTEWSVPAMQVDQVWQTVVVSRNIQGEVTVYTSEGVTTWETEGGICTESNPLRLGRWWDGDIQPSQGLVDFLGIWSRSFDLEEAIQVVNIQGGCTDPMACNYEEEALFHDGNCQYFSECCPIGQLWDPASQTCRLLLDSTSVCGPGTAWDVQTSTCVATGNPSDTDFDGCVGMADLLDLLSAFGTCVEQDPAEGVVDWSCGDPLEYQGYNYETVQIGYQCWFAENLRSENYENGDAIPSNLDDSDWQNTTSGAVAVYGEGNGGCVNSSPDGDACDEVWSLNEYGRLYNWHAVDDARGLCPSGWHVPSNAEWTVMIDELGGHDVAGGKMKTTFGWNGGSNGSNSSGFSGLPGGLRDDNGSFGDSGTNGDWWSSSSNAPYSWARFLYVHESVGHYVSNQSYGFSIRCIQDSE